MNPFHIGLIVAVCSLLTVAACVKMFLHADDCAWMEPERAQVAAMWCGVLAFITLVLSVAFSFFAAIVLVVKALFNA